MHYFYKFYIFAHNLSILSLTGILNKFWYVFINRWSLHHYIFHCHNIQDLEVHNIHYQVHQRMEFHQDSNYVSDVLDSLDFFQQVHYFFQPHLLIFWLYFCTLEAISQLEPMILFGKNVFGKFNHKDFHKILLLPEISSSSNSSTGPGSVIVTEIWK